MNSVNTITHFKGRYYFLSNFYPCTIQHDSLYYPSVEHLFQAAKTQDIAEKYMIRHAKTPSEAKRLGRACTLREDWDHVKLSVMWDAVLKKFQQHTELTDQLLATYPRQLAEGNTWGDTFWGMVNGVGDNWLGRILMTVRTQLWLETAIGAYQSTLLTSVTSPKEG